MAAAQYRSIRFDLLDNDKPHHRRSNFMNLAHPSGFAFLGWIWCHKIYIYMLWNNVSEQLAYCCQTSLPMKVVKPRLATLFMLRTVEGDFGCHLGLKCSSFCKMNIGTSTRSACAAIGWEPYESVSLGNMLLERTAFCFAAVQFKFNYYFCWLSLQTGHTLSW